MGTAAIKPLSTTELKINQVVLFVHDMLAADIPLRKLMPSRINVAGNVYPINTRTAESS
jgi:hypothetical protein